MEIDTGTTELLCAVRDGVALITLNRPEARNAMSDKLTPALRTQIRERGEDPDVGAILITGAGTAFCSGGDVKGMGGLGPRGQMTFEERLSDLRWRQAALTGALVAVRKPTIAALPGYRYHLVHVRGFAGLAPGANGTGPVVSPVADEIARYLREARLNGPALVGHSLGGTLAMMVATRHPDTVERLMVVDMFPFIGAMFGGPSATPDSVRPMAEQIRAGIAGASGDAQRTQIEQTIAGMVRTESMRAAAVEHSLASDPATSGQAMYDIVTTDLTRDLVRFTGPFRVLYAAPPTMPISPDMLGIFYRTAYSGAPQAEVELIPDAYHFIMWDEPARFQRELREFLTAG